MFKKLNIIWKKTIDYFIVNKSKHIMFLFYLTAAILFVINYKNLEHTISSWKREDYLIIIEFLKVIISWPVSIVILALTFIYKFSNSINIFLQKINYFKSGSTEFGQNNQNNSPESHTENTKNIEKKLEEQGITFNKKEVEEIVDSINRISEQKKKLEIDNKEAINLARFLFNKAEYYEFQYLDQIFLKLHTKFALNWLYQQNNHRATIEYFKAVIQLPSNLLQPEIEREVIINVLLSNDLINRDNGFVVVTEKGERFLKFLKLI